MHDNVIKSTILWVYKMWVNLPATPGFFSQSQTPLIFSCRFSQIFSIHTQNPSLFKLKMFPLYSTVRNRCKEKYILYFDVFNLFFLVYLLLKLFFKMVLLQYTYKQHLCKWFLDHLHRHGTFWNIWFLLVIEFFSKHTLASDIFTLN